MYLQMCRNKFLSSNSISKCACIFMTKSLLWGKVFYKVLSSCYKLLVATIPITKQQEQFHVLTQFKLVLLFFSNTLWQAGSKRIRRYWASAYLTKPRLLTDFWWNKNLKNDITNSICPEDFTKTIYFSI